MGSLGTPKDPNNQPQKRKARSNLAKKAFKEAGTILEKHSDEHLYQIDGK